jgi:hypothetical protein
MRTAAFWFDFGLCIEFEFGCRKCGTSKWRLALLRLLIWENHDDSASHAPPIV